VFSGRMPELRLLRTIRAREGPDLARHASRFIIGSGVSERQECEGGPRPWDKEGVPGAGRFLPPCAALTSVRWWGARGVAGYP